ncbi:succinyl-diaminopimelate desuccinylase [Lichenibacterium dinghuense]|uniref:succinyl-diaminopimelate desuccinylase n=1 Tax=Lichenibacterium dinghuense TaxID=2895977 RepID=UPI001F01A623|nr:succinyl-diaminopimelate desuccinylase [Lichenibacterium sp. 6Y81]
MTTPSALDVLQALLRCPSVTPAAGGALDMIQGLLEPAGFAVHRVTFSEPGTPDVENLYARIGTGAPHLVFAGHVDVVPPGDAAAWTHAPFSGDVADGMVWGRGACDMKGGVAAAVAAALAWAARGGAAAGGSVSFLITGDEEGPAVNGTAKLLDWARERGERFDACVLGEPTNPGRMGEMIKNGRRGSLTGEITVEGRQGHVAYPHLADNPIPRLMRALAALTSAPLDAGTAHFDPSNLEIVTVDTGNPSANVIPASCRARFNVRFNDLWTPESLSDEIRARVGTAAVGPHRLAFAPCNALAFLTAPGAFTALVAAAVEAETGVKPALSTTGGTSDARFIVRDCPVVEFGLVGQTMHMVDERVSVADVAALERVYGRVIAGFLSA